MGTQLDSSLAVSVCPYFVKDCDPRSFVVAFVYHVDSVLYENSSSLNVTNH